MGSKASGEPIGIGDGADNHRIVEPIDNAELTPQQMWELYQRASTDPLGFYHAIYGTGPSGEPCVSGSFHDEALCIVKKQMEGTGNNTGR